MERVKVVMIAVLVCAVPGMAAIYVGNGSDWNTPGDWLVDGAVPAAAPGLGDGVYPMSTSMSIASGETGNAWYVILGGGTGGTTETLDVYGTLNINNAEAYNSWLILGGVDNCNASVLTVHDGGQIVTDMLDIRAAGGATQQVVQNGGDVNIGWIWSYGYDYYDTKVEYSLNGGTFDIGIGNYYGNAYAIGATSAYLTIDIAGGTLTIPEASWDADVAGGVILADGVTVTAENMNALLNVSGVGTGIITATIPEPATLALLGLGCLVLRRKK